MHRAYLKGVWSQLPRWGAALLGFGALISGGAKADASRFVSAEGSSRSSEWVGSPAEQVLVRLLDGRVELSQDGSFFEELRLGDTPEAAHLKRLLRQAGASGQPVSVPIGSVIVASGGGSGPGNRPSDSGKGK